jgi:flagellar hook-length control protein FliK
MPAPLTASLPMPATSAPSPLPPAAHDGGDARAAGRAPDEFGRQFQAARRQQAGPQERREAPAPSASSAAAAAPADGADAGDAAAVASAAAPVPAAGDGDPSAATATRPAGKDGDGDDASPDAGAAGTLAAGMLALLGRTPAAAITPVAGGVSKLLAAAMRTPAKDAAAPLAADALPADAAGAVDGAGGDGSVATVATPDVAGAFAAAAGLAGGAPAGADAAGVTPLRKQAPGLAADANAALAALAPAPHAAAAPASVHTLSVASPVGTPAFAQELGQQVAWLGGQDIKQARIRLHPEELGQVDVKVSVQHGGQVDVSFAVQHPGVVHALQQTLPQLDTLLAQHGLSLGQAQVGHQQQGGREGSYAALAGGASADAGEAEPAGAASALQPLGSGLLDAFA